MSFEVKVKRLSHRSWTEVENAWLPHVAQLAFIEPGQKPELALSDFHELSGVAANLTAENELRRSDLPGLRAAMLHEGIYLLHKAANVLAASHQQVSCGMPTWSIATAYQSAFFSMEAMLMILGIAIVEVDNKSMSIDVWPTVQNTASKKEKAAYQIGDDVQFIHHARIEHHHRWAILQRVLRTLKNAPLDGAVINAIIDIDEKQFARQRNRLHYSNIWYFEDLHAYSSHISYCRFDVPPSLDSRLDPAHEDFTLVLATTMFSSAASLLSALGNIAPLLAREKQLLDEACSIERISLRDSYEAATGQTLI